jgi:hypothetical protein
MAFLDITLVDRPFGQAAIWVWKLFSRKPSEAAPESPDEARNRREFIREMIFDNPGSFSNDYDIQYMMSHFPRHF